MATVVHTPTKMAKSICGHGKGGLNIVEDGAEMSRFQGFCFQGSSAFAGDCRISQNPFQCLPFNRTLSIRFY